MKLVALLALLAALFGAIYWLMGRIKPDLSGYLYSGRWWGSLGPSPKGPPVPDPEAEAYSKRLLEERRQRSEEERAEMRAKLR